MRGGPNAGWKPRPSPDTQLISWSLNEGWPECGMETKEQIMERFGDHPGLNEGWPECGMETDRGAHAATSLGLASE